MTELTLGQFIAENGHRTGTIRRHGAAPISFYFAKLWYFERLYPLAFAVAAPGRAANGGLRG
jgi:hypothetical protein